MTRKDALLLFMAAATAAMFGLGWDSSNEISGIEFEDRSSYPSNVSADKFSLGLEELLKDSVCGDFDRLAPDKPYEISGYETPVRASVQNAINTTRED